MICTLTVLLPPPHTSDQKSFLTRVVLSLYWQKSWFVELYWIDLQIAMYVVFFLSRYFASFHKLCKRDKNMWIPYRDNIQVKSQSGCSNMQHISVSFWLESSDIIKQEVLNIYIYIMPMFPLEWVRIALDQVPGYGMYG